MEKRKSGVPRFEGDSGWRRDPLFLWVFLLEELRYEHDNPLISRYSLFLLQIVIVSFCIILLGVDIVGHFVCLL